MVYIYLVIIYIILFNIVTTYRLIKTDMYDTTQKIFQTVIIWLLPLIGVGGIASFLNDEPIVLSEKMSKYILIFKFLFLPFMIKFKTKLDNDIGNYNTGGSDINAVESIGGGGD